MFALWYLSLAVDELRKRFGWSFFDIFYKTNKTDTNTLDNKPANVATPNPAEPAKPAPTATPKVTSTPPAPKPDPTPAPVIKPETPPAPKPTPAPNTIEKPGILPAPKSVPVVEPTRPVVEAPKPVTKPIAPKPTPASAEIKRAAPNNPAKTIEQNVSDVMDKKFMEISKPKENGEHLKNNLKNATMDFLTGEATTQKPPKRNLWMRQRCHAWLQDKF